MQFKIFLTFLYSYANINGTCTTITVIYKDGTTYCKEHQSCKSHSYTVSFHAYSFLKKSEVTIIQTANNLGSYQRQCQFLIYALWWQILHIYIATYVYSHTSTHDIIQMLPNLTTGINNVHTS